MIDIYTYMLIVRSREGDRERERAIENGRLGDAAGLGVPPSYKAYVSNGSARTSTTEKELSQRRKSEPV